MMVRAALNVKVNEQNVIFPGHTLIYFFFIRIWICRGHEEIVNWKNKQIIYKKKIVIIEWGTDMIATGQVDGL